MTAWKDLERRKCRDMGGNRRPSIGPDGWARGSDDDGSLWCYLEAKYVSRYGLRRSWVEKARRESKAEQRPWVIAIDEHNDRHSGIAVTGWLTLVQLAHEAGRIPLPAGKDSPPPATPGPRSTSRRTSPW
jgi:hypothetical protein